MITDIDKDVIMILSQRRTDWRYDQIAPEVYQKYVTVDRKKGNKVLYVKLLKALYGQMRASLLFYRKLRKAFEEYGLVMKPYDLCVANMTTKSGTQLTMVWHVDNLMAYWENDSKLTKFHVIWGRYTTLS
jgi:hypothetical protein